MKPIESPELKANIELIADDHPHAREENPPIDQEIMPPEEIDGPGDAGALEQNNNINEVVERAPRQANNADDHMLLQWRLLIVEICFTAIGVAVQALQTPNPLGGCLQFRCFRIAVVFSFAALLMSVYMYRYSEAVALAFEHVGVCFGVLAFLLAITMD